MITFRKTRKFKRGRTEYEMMVISIVLKTHVYIEAVMKLLVTFLTYE